jgi:RES domain-containing protein
MADPISTRFAGATWHATTKAHAPVSPAELPAYLDHALAHSLAEGGRFNPPGEFGAVYLALDPDTARQESDAPEVILEIDARLSRVVDLIRPDAQRRCGLTPDELCAGNHEPCRRAGRALREEGYEAIRYPAAAGDGINLVVFWDRRQEDSSLRLAGRMEAGDQRRNR